MTKIHMLKNPDIYKVDLVPKGAQQHSKIEIMKGAEHMNFENLSDTDLDEIQTLMNQLKEKLGIKEEDKDKEEVKEETKEEVEEAKEEAVEAKEEVAEAKEDKEDEKCDGIKTETPDPNKIVETDKACETDKECKTETTDELKKALAKSADLESENSKLKEQINKINDENKTKEYINKAAELGNIPGTDSEKLGRILKSISEKDSESYNEIFNILKIANNVIGTGSMFNQAGVNSTGSAEPQTADEAYTMLEKMASERVAKGTSTTENCMADVLATPAGEMLYNKYKELRGGN